MAKLRLVYRCSECGTAHPKWAGQCSSCSSWNSLVEDVEGPDPSTSAVVHARSPAAAPRPIDEAISSAGGICWGETDASLMLKKLPGLFVVGEMIDWEAPTGGYLMQGCFATATRAAGAAVGWLNAPMV